MIKSKLKTILASHDSNQSKLAKEIDVRQPTISAIANNNIKQIPVDVLDKICDHFKCQPGDIMEHIPEIQETTPAATSTQVKSLTENMVNFQEDSLPHITPEKQKPHYKAFTEKDAEHIHFEELLTNVKYQIEIGETFGMDVLALIMKKAKQHQEEKSSGQQ